MKRSAADLRRLNGNKEVLDIIWGNLCAPPSTMTSKLAISMAYLIALISTSLYASAHAETLSSVYTSLEGPSCKVISKDPETGDQTTRCPGTGGYSILVQESDDRASLTIISPKNRSLALNLWDVAIPGFSTLGRQIEWRNITRHRKRTPVGIIVQVDTVDQTDIEHPKPMSFLIVASVAENVACITAKIPTTQPDALLSARRVADDPNRRCLPSM